MRKFLIVLFCLCVPVGASLWCRRVARALIEARVALRPLTFADRGPLVDILQNPKVEEIYGFDFNEVSFSGLVTPPEAPTWKSKYFSVVDDHTGRIIGMVGIEKRTEEEVSLTRVFHPDYWGQGYGTEAAELLIEKAFYQYGIRKIRSTTPVTNERAWRSLEKMGFRRVREIPVGRLTRQKVYYLYELDRDQGP